jgi:hypothetical protein
MKHLKTAINQATKNLPKMDDVNNRVILDCVSTFINNVDTMHMFYLLHGIDKISSTTIVDGRTKHHIHDEVVNNNSILNLPFKNCWFEFPRGFARMNINLTNTPMQNFVLFGMHVYEESPEVHKVTCFGVATIHPANKIKPFCFQAAILHNGTLTDENDKLDVSANLCVYVYRCIRDILNSLSKTTMHTIENVDGIKEIIRGTGKTRTIRYKPSHVIYLCSKKELEQHAPNVLKRVVHKPEYAYEVMGHWRKLVQEHYLGKDRSGEYNQEGWTWVVPHVRGEGEVMKKIRIVK